MELFSGVGLDLGKKLLEKGIEYALGGSLENVFKEPTLTDVHKWINQSVTGIEAKIESLDAKIDAQNLNLMQSQLDSVRSQFLDYVALDPRRRGQYLDLLLSCDRMTSQLLSLSQKYDQAFFLGTVVVAYKLLTRFALYQIDTATGSNGEGHITSLISSGEIQSYLRSAAASRARLVYKLAPQYATRCTVDNGLPFQSAKAQCDILKGNTTVSKTDVMKLAGKSSSMDQTIDGALKYLDTFPGLSKDLSLWRTVNRKSEEQLVAGASCMAKMFYTASGKRCPLLFNRQLLQLKNTATLQMNVGYGWFPVPNAFAP